MAVLGVNDDDFVNSAVLPEPTGRLVFFIQKGRSEDLPDFFCTFAVKLICELFSGASRRRARDAGYRRDTRRVSLLEPTRAMMM